MALIKRLSQPMQFYLRWIYCNVNFPAEYLCEFFIYCKIYVHGVMSLICKSIVHVFI